MFKFKFLIVIFGLFQSLYLYIKYLIFLTLNETMLSKDAR